MSDQAMAIAAEEGFQWFGTDEGVLGRNAERGDFSATLRGLRRARGPVVSAVAIADGEYRGSPDSFATTTFRTWSASVYSRMDSKTAAADLQRPAAVSRRYGENARNR